MIFADATAKTGNLQRRLAAMFMLYYYGMAWACFRYLLGHTSASRWDGRMAHASFLRVIDD